MTENSINVNILNNSEIKDQPNDAALDFLAKTVVPITGTNDNSVSVDTASDVVSDTSVPTLEEIAADTEALRKDSPTEEYMAVVRKVRAAGLKDIDFDRAVDEMADRLGKNKRKVVLALFKKAGSEEMIAQATQKIAAINSSGDAAANAQYARTLEKRYPFPHSDFGEFKYMPFAKEWRAFKLRECEEGSDRMLFTPWCVDSSVRYVDRQDAYGLRLKVLKGDEDTFVDIDAAKASTAGEEGALAVLKSLGVRMDIVEGTGVHHINRWISAVTPEDEVIVYDRCGQRDDVFITPFGEVVGEPASTVALSTQSLVSKSEPRQGTLDGWTTAARAAMESGVLHFQIGVVAGGMATIIEMAGLDSCLLAYTGKAGRGKSTAGELQVSWWGPVEHGMGLAVTWNSTTNALEIVVSKSSGAGANIDEAKTAKGDVIQEFSFRVTGGSTKTRMDRSGNTLRDGAVWNTFVTMSVEESIAQKIRGAGDVVTTGLGARLLELDVTGTPLFADEFAAKLRDIKNHTGHAGPEFVKALMAKGYHKEPATLVKLIDERTAMLIEDTPADQPRAARIAAVAWMVAEIAVEIGLIPDVFPSEIAEEIMPQTEDGAEGFEPLDDRTPEQKTADSTRTPAEMLAVRLWRESRKAESADSRPEANLIQTLRKNLITRRGVDVVEFDPAERDRPNRPVKAWRVRAQHWTTPGTVAYEDVYAILVDHLGELSGGASNDKAAKSALAKAGGLIRSPRPDRKEIVWGKFPGLGEIRVVVIPAWFIEGQD